MAKAFSILFSDHYDEEHRNALAECRTLASEPFGGRYRLIDFVLSSLVNSGIRRVGILTKAHYGSLVDHLGWGKDWDLNRREGGLQILTPFLRENLDRHTISSVDALLSARGYISDTKEDLVILAATNMVANVDFSAAMDYHLSRNSDITVIYHNGRTKGRRPLAVKRAPDGRIVDAEDGRTDYTSMHAFLMKKTLLLELLNQAELYRWTDIQRDFVIRNLRTLRVFGFEHQGFCRMINSVEEYYEASMSLLQERVRTELFTASRPILTQVKNSAPAFYGYESQVENSLVADGCTIEGRLKNCIVFRNVVVEKGAVLENCILMQHTHVGAAAHLSCVITDKNVVIGSGRMLSGYAAYPFVVEKNKTV